MDELERRRLLPTAVVTGTAPNKTLTVTGDNDAVNGDVIVVQTSGSNLIATDSGTQLLASPPPESEVQFIVVNAVAGADAVTITGVSSNKSVTVSAALKTKP